MRETSPSAPWRLAALGAGVLAACFALASGRSREAPPGAGLDLAADGGWEVVAADGVKEELSPLAGEAAPAGASGAIRLDIDFQGHGGYAIARRRLALDLPDNYQFVFWVRGEAPPENLEFKLLDASGDNVWWAVRRDFAFPRDWQRIVVKKRHLAFAWGPAGGGDIRHAGALEIAVSAGQGGRGTVDLAGFTFEPLPAPHPYDRRPVATASSSLPGREPALALAGGAGWHSLPEAAAEQWLAIDFLERRELGGLVIDWYRDDFATRFAVLTSDDGATWQVARTVERGGSQGRGGRSFVFLPETDARYLRLRLLGSSRGRGYGIRAIGVLPVEVSASPNAFFAAVAKGSPRGSYPRAIGGEQSLWTLVGVDGGHDQGLLEEDGRLEAGSGGFSVEPFVFVPAAGRRPRGSGQALASPPRAEGSASPGGELVGWSDVRTAASLAAGFLPIPSVRWRRAGLALEVTAFAAGTAASPELYARYRLRNRTAAAARARLFLVLRP
ncbi:MAG: discoidin domain-containing protein, partial [Acidobacteria bacterium]|nr:discoidin domain-containing protein [Acidobacteriota bacterium]